MPKITTNQPLISHYSSPEVSAFHRIGWDLLHLNISTTPDVMTVHHYSLHPRPVIAQFSQWRGGGRLPTNSKGPTSDTEGVLAAWGARHYWSRSRIGGRGGRGGCFSYSSSSFCQPAPNVCQRSNALHSDHQLRSFGSCGFGACQYVLFWCTLVGVITLSRGHKQRSSIDTRIGPFE